MTCMDKNFPACGLDYKEHFPDTVTGQIAAHCAIPPYHSVWSGLRSLYIGEIPMESGQVSIAIEREHCY